MKSLLSNEMTYTNVYLGNHQALQITSTLIKFEIFKEMCLGIVKTENDNVKIHNIVTCQQKTIDQKLEELKIIILEQTAIQNPHIMYCTILNGFRYTFIIEKHHMNIYLIWQRFNEQLYKGTILDGFFIIDDKHYANILWSIDAFQLPLLSENEIVKLLEDNDECDEEDTNFNNFNTNRESCGTDGIDDDDDVSDSSLNEPILIQQSESVIKTETIITELMAAEDFIKAKMVRQAKRDTKCTFFIRMVNRLCGDIINEESQIIASQDVTFKLTDQVNFVLGNYFEKDNTFNNCNILSWLDQIWAYECDDLSKSHLNTILYKPIPYNILHGGLVEARIKSNPLISDRVDYEKFGNFELRYYGADKPCVYNLCAMNNGKIEVYDTACIPTLECQQYVVCLLRKMSKTNRIIVRCIFEKVLKKWIPMHYLSKSETKIITKQLADTLGNKKQNRTIPIPSNTNTAKNGILEEDVKKFDKLPQKRLLPPQNSQNSQNYQNYKNKDATEQRSHQNPNQKKYYKKRKIN
jgi:hypothetical protein